MRAPRSSALRAVRAGRALLRGAWLFAVLLCAAQAGARPVPLEGGKVEAAEPVLELLVLHATHAKRGIDPTLRGLPELTKAPFAAFDSYAVLERVRLPLRPDARAMRRLPNGRVLGSELLAAGKDGAVRFAASISEPGGSAFLPLLEVRARLGQHFIVAGQSYKSGILVLVLTLVR
jgi:hypothetical protein